MAIYSSPFLRRHQHYISLTLRVANESQSSFRMSWIHIHWRNYGTSALTGKGLICKLIQLIKVPVIRIPCSLMNSVRI